jgi:hypothetical protein
MHAASSMARIILFRMFVTLQPYIEPNSSSFQPTFCLTRTLGSDVRQRTTSFPPRVPSTTTAQIKFGTALTYNEIRLVKADILPAIQSTFIDHATKNLQ